jgi:hypothetical protein
MRHSDDISRILSAWPYDPEHDARIITTEDGRSMLQVRTTLGLEQIELDGRPDGQRPYGEETAFEYYQKKLEVAKLEGNAADFELSAKECGELFNEGTLFYFRYLRMFQLQDWTRTARDTARNLRVFDFIRRYAKDEEDQLFLEKWRPYVLRVNATAETMMAMDQNAFDKALRITSAAMDKIRSLEDLPDETFTFEKERALSVLEELSENIRQAKPVSTLERLERELKEAIELQDFERAAVLRDRIRDTRRQSSTCEEGSTAG